MKVTTHFDTLYIEGFGPYIEGITFKFKDNGVTVISGPNGSGKTKFFSALFWVIYGITLGDHSVEPWDESKTDGYQGTLVSLSFTKGKVKYKIIRCLNYKGKVEGASGKNRLIFKSNIKSKDTEKKKRNIQKDIIEAIGFSPELFKTAVLFGQKLPRFIGTKSSDKKEILEEAFNIDYISEVKSLASKTLNDLLKVNSEILHKIAIITEKYNSLGKRINDLETLNISWENTHNENILEIENSLKATNQKLIKTQGLETIETGEEISKLREWLSKITEQIRQYNSDSDKLKFYNSQVNGYNIQIHDLTKQISKIKTQLSKPICSECGNKLYGNKLNIFKTSKNTELSKTTQTLERVNAEATKLSNNINTITWKLKTQDFDSLTNEEKEVSSKINRYLQKSQSVKLIQEYKEQIENLEKKLKILKVQKNDTPLKISRLTKRYKILGKTLESENNKLESLRVSIENYQWVINDPLSNSGMKAFIFDSRLKKVNNIMSNYSRIINFRPELRVNLDSAHKEVNAFVWKGDYEKPYDDLSGGQQQLIDLTIAFASNIEICSGERSTNILFLDEVSESLDPENIEKVLEIIEEIAKDRQVLLITHRKDFMPRHSEVIGVVNEKDRSRMVL